MPTGIKKTHEQFVKELHEVHAGKITLCAGETYTNNKTKVRVRCEVDGHEWEAQPRSILNGHGCRACMAAAFAEIIKTRQYKITTSFVGQTTKDGHLILEHSGYHQTPTHKKLGKVGNAKYTYKCGQCGGIGEAIGNSLKTPGHTPGCKSCSRGKRESIGKHLKNKRWANSLCHYYIYTVDDDLLLKLGISNDCDRRATYGPDPDRWYTSPLYVSQKYPRSWVWVAEQIILKETEDFAAPIPERWGEKWSGQSELRRGDLDTDEVIMMFLQLMEEIAVDGFHAVYIKYTNKTKTPFTA